MTEQLQKDAAFYWSICVLRQLRELGLLTELEYARIRDISAEYYGTELLVL